MGTNPTRLGTTYAARIGCAKLFDRAQAEGEKPPAELAACTALFRTAAFIGRVRDITASSPSLDCAGRGLVVTPQCGTAHAAATSAIFSLAAVTSLVMMSASFCIRFPASDAISEDMVATLPASIE